MTGPGKLIYLTPEEEDAVDSILGHALEQSHDTIEGDYLQYLIDGGRDDFAPTLEREGELEVILLGLLKRIANTPA